MKWDNSVPLFPWVTADPEGNPGTDWDILFGSDSGGAVVNDFTIATGASMFWMFDQAQGLCISADEESLTTIIDNYGNGSFQNLTSFGAAVFVTGKVADPGAPPSDTLGNLAAWCESLYNNMVNQSFFTSS